MVQGSNPTVDSGMFMVNITTIYSVEHGLCTLTAVPRSTQPSILRGMVKRISANKWRWWEWLLAAYRQPTCSLHVDSQPGSFVLV